MSLFQPSALKKYLSQPDTDLVQKGNKKYAKYIHNGTIQENIQKVIDKMVSELNGLREEDTGTVENS